MGEIITSIVNFLVQPQIIGWVVFASIWIFLYPRASKLLANRNIEKFAESQKNYRQDLEKKGLSETEINRESVRRFEKRQSIEALSILTVASILWVAWIFI